ncbi:hypothetical protein F0562_014165 [Nyssa sinensis]|uniref:non-specific serine/threonine protein kinase n=1 Tax=Nyssa sinensis TaxID=561372 RepID=A0A5J4ZMQ1_9ASTE|nr:hypothetical protein F0562_014165 [Nyssa sinensis]
MMFLPFIFFCFSSLSLSKTSIAVDTIAPNQTLTDNGETLVSSGGRFVLGFFNSTNSNNRYIGIWFQNVPQQTPVWVANRNNPLPDSSGVLTITATGNVVITNNQTNIAVWSSNSSSSTVRNPVLQLLDTGNLVVKIGSNSGNYLWQSFDYPCDTLLPGMKFGWNLITGQEWYMTSWRSLQDPSSGDYTYRLDVHGLPQLVLRQGSSVRYRSGPWDGVRFGVGPVLGPNAVFTPMFVFNATHIYYSFENNDNATFSRFVVSQSGSLQYLTWNQVRGEWVDIISLQADNCDKYAACGSYGKCNINDSPICQCPDGFTPRLPQDWDRLDWTSGCIPRTPLNCSVPAGFRRFPSLKLPDRSFFLVNRTVISPEECRAACLRNCSCVAYAVTDIISCVVWLGDVVDIREYNEGGHDLYIRIASSELGSNSNGKRTAVIASVSVISGVIILGLISCYVIWKRTARRRGAARLDNPSQDNNQSIEDEELELPLIDLVTISTATNNFSFTNKIGEGGFGSVYRNRYISDASNGSVVSSNGNFKLGFFSPGKSENRYVGIWFSKVPLQTVVWVANRDNPLKNRTGAFKITDDGNIAVFYSDNDRLHLWSTNVSMPAATSSNSTAKLLPSGNLVLTTENGSDRTEMVAWQSFDYPTDNVYSGMKFGLDVRTGLNRILTSWKSDDDPAQGEFTIRIDPRGVPQIFMYKGSAAYFRVGPWNGLTLSGVPLVPPQDTQGIDVGFAFANYSFVSNRDEVYAMYGELNPSTFSRMVLKPLGTVERQIWLSDFQEWYQFYVAPQDRCDHYGWCGASTLCNNENTVACACLPGFEYSKKDLSCVEKRKAGTCGKGEGEGFIKLAHVKLPDARTCRLFSNLSLEECEMECLKSCNCTGYTSADIVEGRGCFAWYDLKEKQRYRDMLFLDSTTNFSNEDTCNEKSNEKSKNMELTFYDLDTIVAATDNFSIAKKLGQGGYGPVYKVKSIINLLWLVCLLSTG